MLQCTLRKHSVPRGADGTVIMTGNICTRVILEDLNGVSHRASDLSCIP